MKDGDLPGAVRHEKEIVGLVELRYFQLRVCFEVHCAGETSNVLVAGLVHHGERVEEGIPGGVEGHGAFYFYEIAMAADGFGFDNDERMRQNYDERIPPRDPCNLLRALSPCRYPLEMRRYKLGTGIWRVICWRCACIHWILESGAGGRFLLIPSLLLPPNKISPSFLEA
jgi:hypothetical protein